MVAPLGLNSASLSSFSHEASPEIVLTRTPTFWNVESNPAFPTDCSGLENPGKTTFPA